MDTTCGLYTALTNRGGALRCGVRGSEVYNGSRRRITADTASERRLFRLDPNPGSKGNRRLTVDTTRGPSTGQPPWSSDLGRMIGGGEVYRCTMRRVTADTTSA